MTEMLLFESAPPQQAACAVGFTGLVATEDMQYEGKLYGNMGRKYFDTGKTTEDWDALWSSVIMLRSVLKELMATDEIDQLSNEQMQEMKDKAWCPEMLADASAHLRARYAMEKTERLVATADVSHGGEKDANL